MTVNDEVSGLAAWPREAGAQPAGSRTGALVGGLIERLPRPLRFLGVGGVGLLTDLAVFTAIPQHLDHPLTVRLVSLAVATLVTWRLNRLVTFERSGRRQHAEAMRYAVVTLVAQGTSYGVFALLVLTLLGALPQAATVIGAAIAAVVSYNGHRLYAFAPIAASPSGVIEP
ncbi:GtrA family protein [Rhodoplanes sp. SY1]|uniref:GtrA family protein n=1 Tax=Rhodoplanes sp. SY1 TaxID=3166646 RepID=UPI0038B4D045